LISGEIERRLTEDIPPIAIRPRGETGIQGIDVGDIRDDAVGDL
jgi:hypothetical protein